MAIVGSYHGGGKTHGKALLYLALVTLSFGCERDAKPVPMPLTHPVATEVLQFDRTLIPAEWEFIADATEKYHRLNTEAHIVTWLRDAPDEEIDQLKQIGNRIADIGYDRVEEWMDEHRKTPEGDAFYWFYLLLDFADALPTE